MKMCVFCGHEVTGNICRRCREYKGIEEARYYRGVLVPLSEIKRKKRR